MKTYTRASLTPMQNMRRHFAQKHYNRYLRAFRRAYRLGGFTAVRSVLNAMLARVQGEHENHYKRVINAFNSFMDSQ